jgi:HSP20 family molecular chaperone IbpA
MFKFPHSLIRALNSTGPSASALYHPYARSIWGLSRPRRLDSAVDPFALVERRMNDLFNLPGIIGDSSSGLATSWSGPFSEGLRVDVTENDKNYVVKADIPGVKKEEVSITLKDDILNISGERTSSKEEKDEQRHVVERSIGRFARSIRLPTDADPESIEAAVEDGVLKLTIEKRPTPPEEAPKRIPIA